MSPPAARRVGPGRKVGPPPMSMREASRLSVATAASAPSYQAMRASRQHSQTTAASAAPGNAAARAGKRGRGERKVVHLSAILRQVPSSVEANKISVVEKYVTEVDELPDRFLDVEILFLSHNSISTLAGFQQFRQLRVLSLACNCIESFTEIEALSDFPSLQVLNLEGNPVTIWPFYRLHAILRMPKLKMLDSKEVKPAERESAPSILKEEGEMLQLMFSNYFLQKKLEGAMTRIKLHSELMAVAYGRMSALNRADLPAPTSLDTRKYLEFWEIENNLGPKERDRVLGELRMEVRRVKLSQSTKDMDVTGVFDVFKALVSEGEDPSQALRRRPGMSEHAQWQLAFRQVSMAQQTTISRLLSRLQEVKTEAEAKTLMLHNQSSAINRMRAENQERERNAALDREALIRELRAQVGSLEAASGLSISTLSPVKTASVRTPAANRPVSAAPARGVAASRRLAMSSTQQERPVAEQQLSNISAAPRTDGRRLPSGRRAGGSENAVPPAALGGTVSSAGDENVHTSFELPDDENLRGDLRGDAVPFIATRCSPASAISNAAAAAAGLGVSGRQSPGDDVEIPAPRAPPQPMEQAGSARPSPAKGGGDKEGKDRSAMGAFRSVRDSMGDTSAGLSGQVGVWEGGWGVGGGHGSEDAAEKKGRAEKKEELGDERLTELTRTLGRYVVLAVWLSVATRCQGMVVVVVARDVCQVSCIDCCNASDAMCAGCQRHQMRLRAVALTSPEYQTLRRPLATL